LVVDVIAEAEGKSKYQILQKLNANTKIITETEHKYQIAEAEGKSKYQILQKRKAKYHSKKIKKTERKYQIAKLKRR
jgi:hypothetical protein